MSDSATAATAARPRVWIVTPELHRRTGTERCLCEQVERWKDRFSLSLFTMETDQVDLSGVAVYPITRIPGPHLFRYLWWYWRNPRVRAQVARAQGGPDVVYSPGINCADADSITVHIIFQKHWEVVRASTYEELRHPRSFPRALHHIVYWKMLHRLERRIYGGRATLAALSNRDKNDLIARFGRAPEGITVIPHGVDTTHFTPEYRLEARARARADLGFGDDQVVLMILGNDLYKKGLDVAIRALAELPDEVVIAFLVSETLRPALRALAEASGVLARVHIVATDPAVEVRDRYAAADILVQPSREDAFSMPPLEAMASGLPVVVSHVLGFAELVHDGQDALVTDNPEDPAELASAVRRLVEDPVLARAIAERGLQLAQGNSWDENARATGDLIESAMPRRRAGAR